VLPPAQFEQKQYEQAVCSELSVSVDGEYGFFMSAGQVLEAIVGYDAVSAPARNHLIWRLLEVPRPRGVRLVPDFWDATNQPTPDRLPITPISLVLQFKRPDRLRGARAKQWHLWRTPYFRFERRGEQHRVLVQLERALGDQALVRYAAPAFSTIGQLEAAHRTRQVIARSGFVSPGALGKHKVWTYVGPGVDGKGNPGGRTQAFPTFDSLLEQMLSRSQGSTAVVRSHSIGDHLDALGAAATYRRPGLRTSLDAWARALDAAGVELSPHLAASVLNLAAIVSLTQAVGATWRLLIPNSSRAK
jgi:hypothetical protein